MGYDCTNNKFMSSKMKHFLGVYGVDKIIISPFCKDLEIISELRDELLL